MDIWVFDGDTLDPLGILQTPTELAFTELHRGAGNAQVWLPMTDTNIALCKIGNYVWVKENDFTFEIELIQTESSTEGSVIMIQGNGLEGILSKRIIWGQYIKSAKPVALMEGLINDQMINPTDENRVYPHLSISHYTDEPADTKSVQYQSTGGNLDLEMQSLTELYGYGYRVKFDPGEKTLVFKLVKGVNRTIGQSAVSPVVLSTDFENLLTSEYTTDHLSYRNVALVQGEGTGAERTSVTVGGEISGRERRELYVDARDLQSVDDAGMEMSAEDYQALLTERGNSKLDETKIAENFETSVNTEGNMQYGRDYYLGDTVTVQDKRLGLQLSALVSEVEHTYTNKGHTVNITFGYGQPTLIDKLKRRD